MERRRAVGHAALSAAIAGGYLDRGAVQARKINASPVSEGRMTRSRSISTCGAALKGLNVAYAAIEIVVVHTYIQSQY